MAFIGISGMQYSGASLSQHRILLAEDSNVFTSMISTRMKELFDIDIEICRSFEELEIAYQGGSLEIGFTYYRPRFRGTGINRRIKDMMIRRAIESGFHRIEFRVDSRNKRSQAAMNKLGATREGVLRADTVTWTGHVRDTVMFSILSDEWPPAQTDA